MTRKLQFKRYANTVVNSTTGAAGELIVDTMKKIKRMLNQPHEHACMDAIITVFEQLEYLYQLGLVLLLVCEA